MPEPRDQTPRGAAMRELSVGSGERRGLYQERLRKALAGELAAGRRIRRDFYHVEATPTRARVGQTPMQAAGRENTAPKSVMRQTRAKKSPLPAWYPRTPLRDITALLDEMERRRASLRSAARKRRYQLSTEAAELSPPFALPVTPCPQKLLVSHTDPIAPDVSNAHPSPIPSFTCLPGIESSPRTPTAPGSSVQDDQELVERELKLEKSIDAIERLVRGDLKGKPKVSANKVTQRRTLMSMR